MQCHESVISTAVTAPSSRIGETCNSFHVLKRLVLLCAVTGIPASIHAQTALDLHNTFLSPPDDAKPMMRWWWFGPAVTPDQIRREIDQMRAGGIGGFELASVYPLALNDPARGIRNLRYASPEMVDMLRVAQEHGRKLGMRVDLTLGSGWPFGGPHIPLELAAGRLKLIALATNDKTSIQHLEPGERLLAKFIAAGTPDHWDKAAPKEIFGYKTGRIQRTIWDYGADQPHDVTLYFIFSHTRQMVKRASVGAEGYVLDHMNRAATDAHNREVSEKLLQGFQDTPPHAVFSDSLEVYDSDWTADFPEEFSKRRGYDLIPHLAELWQGGTPEAEAVRHDWGVTLSELLRENYLKPMADFAGAHGTQFRSQTYGEPAATLRDELIPQFAEGEGPQWDRFSFARWASSANHIAGRNITSAETWTWLHSPAFRATPLDMKVEADRMFLQGVNQIIGHGWPYSPPGTQEPGWSLYAAAVFNAHNPWWPIMPTVMRYLQRLSWLLRQGEPANDVAILLPEDDAQASFTPGHVSVTDSMKRRISPALMQAVLGSGHNVDYIDSSAVESRAFRSKVLIVPPTTRMRLATAQAIGRYAERGGKVVFVDTIPSLAPGLQDAKETPALQAEIRRLKNPAGQTTTAQLAATLRKLLPPAFDVSGTNGSVGFIQRRLSGREIYFVANTSPVPQTFQLHVAGSHSNLTWWSIETERTMHADEGETVTLPPYGSRILITDDAKDTAVFRGPQYGSILSTQTLAHWTATFPGSAFSAPLSQQQDATTDWTGNAATKFYSGEVRFTARFRRTAKTSNGIELRFAEGKPLPDIQPADRPGIRAWYDAPVREAATVLINGKEAGVLWHPPYTLDITAFTKPGFNTVEVRVYNTAINALAGQPPRDYTALKAKYGDRFQMQDMDHLEPLPSGIFGPVRIVTLAPH